jgi:hypothetical protein
VPASTARDSTRRAPLSPFFVGGCRCGARNTRRGLGNTRARYRPIASSVYSPPTHAPTQLSHPQHELEAHPSQNSKLPHLSDPVQGRAQIPWLKMQTCEGGQGSSSSQRPSLGTQAPKQSRHSGQLEVAHDWQNAPGVQLEHASALHATAQTPLEKIQTPPGQSAWSAQGPVPVPVDVVVFADVDEMLPLGWVPPWPPAPALSTTTVPPHAASPSQQVRARPFIMSVLEVGTAFVHLEAIVAAW